MVSRTSGSETSTAAQILDAAEAVLRRHGADKTNVVDIARALGMSHANVYRHFPNKKALLDEVAARWLRELATPLARIVEDRERPASERLALWFETLRQAKRRKVLRDPELFRVYHALTEAARDVSARHLAELHAQVERMVRDGVEAGELKTKLDPTLAARAFFHAGFAFHHPALLVLDHGITDDDARAMIQLLVAGLKQA